MDESTALVSESLTTAKNVLAWCSVVLETVRRCFDVELEGQTGFVVALGDVYGHPLTIFPVGHISEERIARCLTFSVVLARRLGAHFPSHVASWQSRESAEDDWGAAFRFPEQKQILSIWGLPAKWSASVVLAVAMGMSWVTRERAIALSHCFSAQARFVELDAALERERARSRETR